MNLPRGFRFILLILKQNGMVLLFAALLGSLSPAVPNDRDAASPLRVEVLNFAQFEPCLHRETDSLYLVVFWATWCGPCREEYPALQRVAEEHRTDKFRLILVSLDFPNQLESRLKPFLQKNPVPAIQILLNDPHQNEWIDKVDPSWSGSIPFSVLYDKTGRESFEHAFTYEQLETLINKKLHKS